MEAATLHFRNSVYNLKAFNATQSEKEVPFSPPLRYHFFFAFDSKYCSSITSRLVLRTVVFCRMATILSLPRDVQLEILQFCHSIEDALHLSQSCRTLHFAWQSGLFHILNTILPRTVLCYLEALEFSKAQEGLDARSSKDQKPSGYSMRL